MKNNKESESGGLGEMHAALHPFTEDNQRLAANVRPGDWKNPAVAGTYQLIVVGAGTAGLVTAAGAAGLGARVALIERDLMGGDCLNTGCVPSKALIRCAKAVSEVNRASQFGVAKASLSNIDFPEMMQRMRRLRADISRHDSAARFRDLGVDVFFGQASFIDHHSICVRDQNGNSTNLEFKKAVIAAGARAAAPPIPGLDSVHYLTNETVFSLTALPKKFAIIGAGPIGAEMAQAFARFGSTVVLIETAARILPREDAAAAAFLQDQFDREGIVTWTRSTELAVSPINHSQICVTARVNNQALETIVDQLLVAVGRTPNVEGLNLPQANVKFDKQGILVNDFMQTSNPKIYAAGDIASKFKFTHSADFLARIVIQNALFALGPFGRKRASRLTVPWTTFTSPEVAQVGLTTDQASESGIEIDTYTQDFSELDRAILDGSSGFVKINVRKGTDKIVGATIVSDHAGDLISEVTLAMTNGLGLNKIGATIHPYPTMSEAIRKLSDQLNRTKLTPFNRRLLKRLLWWNT